MRLTREARKFTRSAFPRVAPTQTLVGIRVRTHGEALQHRRWKVHTSGRPTLADLTADPVFDAQYLRNCRRRVCAAVPLYLQHTPAAYLLRRGV